MEHAAVLKVITDDEHVYLISDGPKQKSAMIRAKDGAEALAMYHAGDCEIDDNPYSGPFVIEQEQQNTAKFDFTYTVIRSTEIELPMGYSVDDIAKIDSLVNQKGSAVAEIYFKDGSYFFAKMGEAKGNEWGTQVKGELVGGR